MLKLLYDSYGNYKNVKLWGLQTIIVATHYITLYEMQQYFVYISTNYDYRNRSLI